MEYVGIFIDIEDVVGIDNRIVYIGFLNFLWIVVFFLYGIMLWVEMSFLMYLWILLLRIF